MQAATVSPVVIVGLGQLGRIFAGGFLRTGHTVVPVNREDDTALAAAAWPSPELVLVAVAEGDLHKVLGTLPGTWKSRLGLIQNELLPRDWEEHRIATPTVAAIWFEKKKGTDAKPLLPTPIFGPEAAMMAAALEAIEIPARALRDEDELLYELVRKNVYILTANIAGLKTGGTVGQLWEKHRELTLAVAHEVIDLQDWLTGRQNDRERLIQGMAEAFEADPGHQCTGRSAPQRLARALGHGNEAGLKLPTLHALRPSA